MKVISVAIQKGGSGKTTTAQALASILGEKGYKVLLIDMDSQANATYASGVSPDKTISDVFAETCSAESAIVQCDLYSLMPADERLANLETLEVMDYTILEKVLSSLKINLDYVIIDCPPSLGNILKTCLMASEQVIIPVEARPFALAGLDRLNETIKAVKRFNKKLSVLGILLVKYSDRTVLNRQIRELLDEKASDLNTSVFSTKIREGIAVPEAQTMGKPLILYAPKSNPCIDYIAFTEEVLNRLEGKNNGK